ncbi:hypothetical protein LTR53_014094, partial [Teratosphaeriaceae sp. CCFEE 6253]
MSAGTRKVTSPLQGAVGQMVESRKHVAVDHEDEDVWMAEFVDLDRGAETTVPVSLEHAARDSTTTGPGSCEVVQSPGEDANNANQRTADEETFLDVDEPTDVDDEHESNSSALSDPPSDLDGEDSS